MKIIARNRKAHHDYFILETYEAGIILRGSEIKSIRAGKVNIGDSYVDFKNESAYLIGMHIAKFDKSNIFNHEELRERRLLLNKREIKKLISKINEKGNAVIPLKVYLKEALCKVEIALVKGKKLYDKREDLKRKDQEIRIKKGIGKLWK